MRPIDEFESSISVPIEYNVTNRLIEKFKEFETDLSFVQRSEYLQEKFTLNNEIITKRIGYTARYSSTSELFPSNNQFEESTVTIIDMYKKKLWFEFKYEYNRHLHKSDLIKNAPTIYKLAHNLEELTVVENIEKEWETRVRIFIMIGPVRVSILTITNRNGNTLHFFEMEEEFPTKEALVKNFSRNISQIFFELNYKPVFASIDPTYNIKMDFKLYTSEQKYDFIKLKIDGIRGVGYCDLNFLYIYFPCSISTMEGEKHTMKIPLATDTKIPTYFIFLFEFVESKKVLFVTEVLMVVTCKTFECGYLNHPDNNNQYVVDPKESNEILKLFKDDFIKLQIIPNLFIEKFRTIDAALENLTPCLPDYCDGLILVKGTSFYKYKENHTIELLFKDKILWTHDGEFRKFNFNLVMPKGDFEGRILEFKVCNNDLIFIKERSDKIIPDDFKKIFSIMTTVNK